MKESRSKPRTQSDVNYRTVNGVDGRVAYYPDDDVSFDIICDDL